eukprot:1041255-Pyramimonas_sp.AAC.1
MHEMVRHLFSRLATMAPLESSLEPGLPSPKKASMSSRISVDASAPPSSVNAEDAEGEGHGAVSEAGLPYGLASALEVFQFLISLVSCEDASSEDLCVFGLTLVNAALDEGRQVRNAFSV